MRSTLNWSEVNQVFDHFAASLVGKPRVTLTDGH
jgi:hypothetical protein